MSTRIRSLWRSISMAGLVLAAIQALPLPAPAAAAAAAGTGGGPVNAAPPVRSGVWPSLEEQLQADHVVPGSALARLITENQDFGLLGSEEPARFRGLPPWLRVLWRKHHPDARYPASDPTGGYPRILRDIHQWLITHQDLKPHPAPLPGSAEPVRRNASETGEERISGSQTSARSESAIRINRANTNEVVAASNDILFGGAQAQFYSADGGATWGQTALALVGSDSFQSDPAVDWTSDGTAWTTTIGIDASTFALTLHAFKSTNGGATWTYDADFSTGTFNDKDMAWVDHSPTSPYKDHIYAIWDTGPAWVARRTGPGGSWQAPVKVSGAETLGTAVGGDVKTNANGDVFAFYPDTGSQGIYVAKSTNGGASFGTPVHIATTFGSFQFAIPADDSRGVLIYPTGGAWRAASVNDVYVAWNDLSGDPGCTAGQGPGSRASSLCKSRIFFARSTDGGATWSAPVKINDPTVRNDQFFPWLVVDESSGRIAVTYYDTIGDKTRTSTNVYYQSSTDRGLTWSVPLKVTSAVTNETTAGTDFGNQYGDYTGLDGIGGHFLPSWTDRRSGGREEIWTARITDTTGSCTPPPAPTGLATQSRVNLSWNASAGATLYNVYRSTSNGGPYSLIGTSTTPAFSDPGVACARTYDYVVTASNGTCSSGVSNQAQATTAACVTSCGPFYNNDFEGGVGPSDWNTGSFGANVGAVDWRGIQACSAHSGSQIFRFGGPTCSATYGPTEYAFAVPGGSAGIPMPPTASSLTLSFWHRYNFPTTSDGASLAIQVDNSGYFFVPFFAFVSGATYNSNIGGGCPPPGSAGAPVFAGTQSSFVNTQINLDTACNWASFSNGGCGGHAVYLAFIGITGCAGTGTGWFLDDVNVSGCQVVTPLSFYTVTPCRVFDTRNGSPLPAGITNFQVAGLCGIPAGAKSVSANLTIVGPQSGGMLTVYPGDQPLLPLASDISFNAGEVRANNAMLGLAGDGTGTINVYAAITGTANLVLDVNGYYQ
jgi:hypothetical protein